jgi:hypothetical protein
MQQKDTPKVFRSNEDPHAAHACYDGWIYLGYTAFDEEIGEETERIEIIPCRRCNDRRQYQEKANTTHRIRS